MKFKNTGNDVQVRLDDNGKYIWKCVNKKNIELKIRSKYG